DGSTATVETLTTVRVSKAGQRFTYDEATDTLIDNQAGRTCRSGEGNFVCDDVPEEDVARTALQSETSEIVCEGGVCDNVPLFALDGSLPGWRAVIGFENYTNIFSNERIREPFLRVLVWNVVFAFATVILAFGLGLGLAIALQDEAMKGRALYRSIYILPYAIPGFLSILVWRGLLNTDFGKVNGALESLGIPGVDWLGTPIWAMLAVLVVNLWLGFPYMFLITTGALTSIPEDLLEAARVDGATPWRSFRNITLPLLLVSTAPLLIGAFAFNFNNFVLIFLLTNGGPPLAGFDVPVGATDLLISFTFNLAQGAGRGNQFALASAIVVLIFIVLATVSATSFRLTKRLEEYYGN
ncbi:MAG: ABC transporter permease subunit, partial [Acidimicrobiia bacterium]|nr:ABC transporter permease subunit [Acidimicrobiia bacterium]